MRFKGKIIGCLIGLLMFGPVGAAFGFIAGHLYDIGYFRAFMDATKAGVHTHAQKVFFENTFKIMGYIAKSDGHVSQNEIEAAKRIMTKMRLTEALKQQAIHLFTEGKQPGFHLDIALTQLRTLCHAQPILLRLFLDTQWEMAGADGTISATKKQTLQYISDQLGIHGFHFHHQHYYSGQNNYHQRYTKSSESMSLQNSYEVLNISQNTTDDEIKKAYRRMMSQHHPDKLIAKGLPPEMIKVATQKTQQIKKAYETLKKSRGF